MDVVLGFFATLGVSTAAGLNAYLPLLLLGILSRSTDLVQLTSPWVRLEEPWVLGLVGAVAVLDFVGDKVPVVDHVLHSVGLVIAPVAGAIAALATAGAVDVNPGVAMVVGVVAALATHGGRTAARPVSTVAMGGTATPIVSLAEDGTSATLTILAFVAPVLAFLAVVGIAALLVWGVRRWRALGRRLGTSSR
ncbi:MAG: DUF4126 domain-containing protein [Solirubrobacterales bacterium]|jgi:hypothetical protein